MSYALNITTHAAKQLASLPHKTQERIRTALDKLASNPYGAALDVKKLSGQENYRLRVGNYRAIYSLHNDVLSVRVLKIGHRREIYQ